MKILLTGANGYIGKRLLPVLLDKGHEVICCVRSKKRFELSEQTNKNLKVIEVDFAHQKTPEDLPRDIDAAYYLIHSMSASTGDFEKMEEITAINFRNFINTSKAKQVIFLGGIVNDKNLSKHLSSRKKVEEILEKANCNTTFLRAGIIVGSGSASFEIIRDLVEKLPVMVAPKWLFTRSQPIAVRDVIRYLEGVLGNKQAFNRAFDIAGPEILTYRDMLLQYAEVRKLRRIIITVPLLTPRLSSYWLYFVTSTTYKLAYNLVDSMKNEVIAGDREIQNLIPGSPIPFKEAVERAFQKIEQNMVFSSWKDSFISANTDKQLIDYVRVPTYGCFKDRKYIQIRNQPKKVLDNIWSIGGDRGWYYADFLWKIRGFLDKMMGGVGLRRGRTNKNRINVGDALDFWRVLVADKKRKRLLLFAEMKLPGEAWLEFRIDEDANGQLLLIQEATFRPHGIIGRFYWYALLILHYFVFTGMIQNLERFGHQK